MDKSLSALCDALKKILSNFKPQHNAISFLLMTGKINQGKTTLLRQSNLTYYPTENETNAKFFYNQQGVILELGESWLNQTENLIAYTLKQLNRCHRNVRISGIVLCVDSSELLLAEPVHLLDLCKSHAQLLERFGQGLGYAVDTALLLTKLDAFAGFCDFFESDHPSDLTKPLGFSLGNIKQRKKLLENYRHQFDQMLEVLSQQIINKLHPARSTIKRTLIREFPLQLTSLRVPVQSLIQNLPLQLFRLKAIYFTSAEQGGLSIDRLNKKIQHEYALTVQDKFPQSNNYRAYFIESALKAFQEQTKRYIPQISNSQKWLISIAAGGVGLTLIGLMYQHFKTTRLLDEASKELLTYEALLSQNTNKTSALYHLSLATTKLDQIPTNFFSVPTIEQLKAQLQNNNKTSLSNNFVPELVADVERIASDPAQTQIARYEALKIYLMLAEPEHYSESEIINWFKQYWTASNQQNIIDKQLLLLKTALKQPIQSLVIKRQIVSDVRNYLNALPATYLYYSLAKNHFPQEKQKISIEGFELATQDLPKYYTKEGFIDVIAALPQIAMQLQHENWVLARQDLGNLAILLEEAYCFEYVTWWQNFVRHAKPLHYQDYQQARQLILSLHQSNAVAKLIELIQQQTSPELNDNVNRFNEKIANQFTNLNLMSTSATNELTQNISELEKFITTLSLVNDQGRTAFELTKTRFQGGTLSDPLSTLYNRSRQLPEPVSKWAKQLADDTWFILINESKNYLNRHWQQTVYREYQMTIASHYPLDTAAQVREVSLSDFDHFFSPQGTLNTFVNNYIKPFLDTSIPQWQPKELNGYVLPISSDITNELIRANVISNMFFPDNSETSKIEFSLQKINLDPVVSNLQLTIGQNKLTDSQNSDSFTQFSWPQNDAKLVLYSIEGNHYELAESGPWAFFKMLQKVNVLVDSNDSSSLQILFEVNGNSGRYVLKTQNQINPFTPGVLAGFVLKQEVT